MCDGFFNDPKHLEEQFYYLTESRISQKIEKGLSGHMGKNEFDILSYLMDYMTRKHGDLSAKCR